MFFSFIVLQVLNFNFALAQNIDGAVIQDLKDAKKKNVSPNEKQIILSSGIVLLKDKLKKIHSIDEDQLKEYLLTSPEEILKKIKESKVGSQKEETAKLEDKFKKVKELNESLFRCSSDCSIRDLYTAINGLASTITISSQIKQCNEKYSSKIIQSEKLTEAILNAQENFDPTCEGAGTKVHHTLFSKSKGGDISGVHLLSTNESFSSLANDVSAVVQASELNADAVYLGRKFPTYNEVKANINESDYASVRLQENMKDAIYVRAVTNALATKMSVLASFGDTPFSQIYKEDNLQKEVDRYCLKCSVDTKGAMVRRLQNVLSRKIPSEIKKMKQPDQRMVVSKICKGLDREGYFDLLKKKPSLLSVDLNPNEVLVSSGNPYQDLDPKQFKGLENSTPKSQMDTAYYDQILNAEIKNKSFKLEAIAKLAYQGEDGLLLLTNSMTEKDKYNAAIGINIGCGINTLDWDVGVVQKAIKEVDTNLTEYLQDLNSKVKPIGIFSGSKKTTSSALDAQVKQLKFMISKNPTAAGEALQDRPTSTTLICHTISELINDDVVKGELQGGVKTALYLGMIVTGGLSAVPMRIIGEVAMGYVAAAGLGFSVTALADDKIKSLEAKENFEEFKNAYYAQGGKDWNSFLKAQDSFKDWQDLKLAWSDLFDFIPNISDVMHLLKTYKTLSRLKAALPELKAVSSSDEMKALMKGEGNTQKLVEIEKKISKLEEQMFQSKIESIEFEISAVDKELSRLKSKLNKEGANVGAIEPHINIEKRKKELLLDRLSDVFSEGILKTSQGISVDVLKKPLNLLSDMVFKKTGPTRDIALKKMVEYSRSITKDYKEGNFGYLFEEIYLDTRLPDTVRKVAFDEWKFASTQNNLFPTVWTEKFKPVSLLREEQAAAISLAQTNTTQLNKVIDANLSYPRFDVKAVAKSNGYTPAKIDYGYLKLKGIEKTESYDVIMIFIRNNSRIQMKGSLIQDPYSDILKIKVSSGESVPVKSIGVIEEAYFKKSLIKGDGNSQKMVGGGKFSEIEGEVTLATNAARTPASEVVKSLQSNLKKVGLKTKFNAQELEGIINEIRTLRCK